MSASTGLVVTVPGGAPIPHQASSIAAVDGTNAHAAEQSARKLQAWSLPKESVADIALPSRWPEQVTREWAWGGATGKGVRVCILDSGVDSEHPDVGGLESAVTVELDEDEKTIVSDDTEGDIAGHGTACAGIVRARTGMQHLERPRARKGLHRQGPVLLAGLRYAVEQEFDVINMSLSTTKKPFAAALHDLADSAYFKRGCWLRRRTTCRSRATRGGSRR